MSTRGTDGPERVPRELLREEVGRFRMRESRRVFDASVHVGRLAGARTGFVLRAQDLPVLDDGLRRDVAEALVADAQPRWTTAWLVRPGTPEPHELDSRWLVAFGQAFATYGREMAGFFVITRSGWRDVVTGEERRWTRLRL